MNLNETRKLPNSHQSLILKKIVLIVLVVLIVLRVYYNPLVPVVLKYSIKKSKIEYLPQRKSLMNHIYKIYRRYSTQGLSPF